ncbi:MlaE family ABC transporter permease [Jiulongibacter sediminis]|uniref:ABC transporter permease n=1 Tax=Jiulongibacter sediminis TaxID=1605367 RepID=A0A0P7C7C0_9BACT|nr:ABC transporter permease [Jiulongibacter sediminis]KPM48294.1 ABC transporter permease [Jiulongibacter sediminis]TBX24833.1 ABC transporter permease [Jiulongibacter sediminis]
MGKNKDVFISKQIDEKIVNFKNGVDFVITFFSELSLKNIIWTELFNQCYQIGLRSLPLITLTGFVTGLVFTQQSRPSLQEFGATSWLPSLVAIAMVRALAPLVTSIIAAGRVGSNIGAELGSMKVTEQIAAMEVSSVNPFNFLVVNRVLAATITIPILSFYTAAVGLTGSFINIYLNEQTNFNAYIINAFDSINFLDLGSALVKAILFGFTIGMVGCYSGYNAEKGTLGVGKAANAGVVKSIFIIFLIEIFVVQVTNSLR